MKGYENNMNYIKEYGDDEKLLLRNHPSLDVLRTWSSQREGLIEWIPTDGIGSALVVYMDAGTPIAVLLRRGIRVTIICTDDEEKDYILERYKKYDSIITIASSFDDIDGETYDSAWMISTDMKYDDSCIMKTLTYIRRGGTLVYACANTYGLKYMAGAQLPINHDYIDHVRSELKEPDMYYVMPDIYFPTDIYTDDRLPQGEDLGGYIALYDDAKWASMDIGKTYGQITKDGKFAEYTGGYVAIYTTR